MTQEEIHQAQKKHGMIMLIVLTLTVFVVGVIAVSAYNIFSLDPPPEQLKKATFEPAPYMGEELEEEDAVLQKTNFLGRSLYGEDGHYIGKLYDAYFDPEQGNIEQISVNVFGAEDGYFILLTANQAEDITLKADTMVVNQELAEFINKPLQRKNDDKVNGLISLRTVVVNEVESEIGQQIAEVTKVTFNESRKLERIYFKTESDPLRGVNEEYYSLPFEAVMFTDPQTTNELNHNIILNKLQASAVKAYSESEIITE